MCTTGSSFFLFEQLGVLQPLTPHASLSIKELSGYGVHEDTLKHSLVEVGRMDKLGFRDESPLSFWVWLPLWQRRGLICTVVLVLQLSSLRAGSLQFSDHALCGGFICPLSLCGHLPGGGAQRWLGLCPVQASPVLCSFTGVLLAGVYPLWTSCPQGFKHLSLGSPAYAVPACS